MKRKILTAVTGAVVLMSMITGCGRMENISGRSELSDSESELTADSSVSGGSGESAGLDQESAGGTAEEIPGREFAAEKGLQTKLLSRVLFYDPEAEGPEAEEIYLEYEYDAVGNQVLEINYVHHMRTEYEYDLSGRLLGSTIYYKDQPHIRYEYEYNAAGDLSKVSAYGGDGSAGLYTEYEYDSSGKLRKETCFNAETSVINSISYGYDEDGRLVEEIYFGEYFDVKEYEYDSAGNLLREQWKCEGVTDEYRVYEYDGAGNQTKMISHHISHNIGGDVDVLLNYREYEYDEWGNLLLNVLYDSEGNILYDEINARYADSLVYEYIIWQDNVEAEWE